MDHLALRDEMDLLLQDSRGPSVSIFMPTHRAGAAVNQGPIRMANLLREAERQLVELGLRSVDARALLSQVDEATRDSFFWRHQADGLAIFVAHEFLRTLRLPLPLDELVVVSNRFHIKPLFRLFNADARFYVLTLSQKEVRLFECSQFGIREVALEDVPHGIDDALKFDNPAEKERFHTLVRASVTGRRDALFRGHGTDVDDSKTDLLRYFLKVNDGVRKSLREDNAPLVLAGVDYLLPLYKEANTYNYLFEEGITGNPDGLSTKELHAQAWHIMEPYFGRALADASSRFMNLAGTGLASTDEREIVGASYFGRVDTLFVASGIREWGRFDPNTGTAEFHPEPLTGDEDLLDFAAIQTFLHRGMVYTVPPERVPGSSNAAATFRY